MTIETIARIVIGTIIGIVIKTLKIAMITKAVIKAVIKAVVKTVTKTVTKTLKTAIISIINTINTVFKGSYAEGYDAGRGDTHSNINICEGFEKGYRDARYKIYRRKTDS